MGVEERSDRVLGPAGCPDVAWSCLCRCNQLAKQRCRCYCRDKSYIAQYAKALLENAFHAEDATCTVGFSLHVADVYVDELVTVAERKPEVAIPHSACVKLLSPFVVTLGRTRQTVLLERVRYVHASAWLTRCKQLWSRMSALRHTLYPCVPLPLCVHAVVTP